MKASTSIAVVTAGIVVGPAVFLAYQNRRLLFDTCPPSAFVQFVPNPHNDKALVVYGLNSDELKVILSEFAKPYEMPNGVKYRMRTEDQRLRVDFPDDIEPDLFSFLVNYVQYPKTIDLQGRSIVSTGTVTLSLDFGLPTPALNGQNATFYAPTADSKYDLVFVRVAGRTY